MGLHRTRSPVGEHWEIAMTLTVAVGPPMNIVRGEPWKIQGQRFRSSLRAVLDLSATTVRLRIGVPGAAALIDVELAPDVSVPTDPSYYVTLTAEQTALLTVAVYEYVFVSGDGRPPLLQGPVEMDSVPRPAA